MFGGVKCILSGKKCRKTDPECPEYKNSCYYSAKEDPKATPIDVTEAGDDGEPVEARRYVVVDGECRYRGAIRWEKEKMLDRDFVDGGREHAEV